jgi:putative phosphoesterase
MVIGILSDNHGRIEPVRLALEIFRARDVRTVFHCGDVGGIDTIELIAGAVERFYFVWGNTDQPSVDWVARVESLGVHWPDGPIVTELIGRRIAMAHGHEWQLAALKHDDSIDYLFSGHSHRKHDERLEHVRWINPGALHRVAVKTVATLDLATDTLQFRAIDHR